MAAAINVSDIASQNAAQNVQRGIIVNTCISVFLYTFNTSLIRREEIQNLQACYTFNTTL